MAWIAGVDGCKAGWIAALVEEAGDAPPSSGWCRIGSTFCPERPFRG